MPLRFRCSRTGLLYPADYIEEWGKKYGIGLGPVPISEALVNDYHRPIVKNNNPPMHALSVCRAQVDLVEVTQEEIDANTPILSIDDKSMVKRTEIMIGKQLKKSSKLKNYLAVSEIN